MGLVLTRGGECRQKEQPAWTELPFTQRWCGCAGMEDPVLLAGPEGSVLLPEDQQHEWRALREAAEVVAAAVRIAAEESEGLLAARRQQEQGVQLVTGHCDAARVKVEDSDDDLAGAEEDTFDFLAPFLPNVGARDMNEEEAAAARASCLVALRERLAGREGLVRDRVTEETAELARLEALLAADRHRMGPAEVVRVEEQVTQAAFRLLVARRRLQGHAAHAAECVAEIEQRLAADKRLVAARQGRRA